MQSSIGKYIIQRTIGEGSTSKVKLAIEPETGKEVAIKIIPKNKVTAKSTTLIRSEREIAILKLFNHPNIVKIFEVFESDEYLFLVMEYMQKGELLDYLISKKAISTTQSLFFFQQIIYAVEYSHSHLISHRDLKLENILLDSFGNVKIVDFGMAGLVDNQNLLNTSCGSPHYVAPEVVTGKSYDPFKADIWSCGIILYVLLVGRLPFDADSIQEVLIQITQNEPEIPSHLSPDKSQLLQGMLQKDPQKRMTIQEIKENPWFCSNFPRYFEQPKTQIDPNFFSPRKVENLSTSIISSLSRLGIDENSIIEFLTSQEANWVKVFYSLN
ncbi:protein kinase [Anaeramoeba ignava]|uniref:Protein kinase n=1 Tax=Anaeramoeba ignava TaxID=1746090 RepID=A0A9Q0L795_ANAIG|nr:protein kinase [Anaeramoeba ignava]